MDTIDKDNINNENDIKSFENLTYEEAIAELEKILDKMDRGELALNESMDNFERGIALIKYCENILNSYERRITKIITDKDGTLKDVEFGEE